MDKERKALEALLEALELDELIRRKELEDLLPAPKPLDKALESLKKEGVVRERTGKVDGRREAGKKRAAKNRKRKALNKKQQRWRRRWNERMLEEAKGGNWYPYLEGRWRRRKRPLAFSEEQWLKHVQPAIPEGCVIELRRYCPDKPVTLDNIVVYDNSNGNVLFDGAEWKMKEQGWIL